MAAVRHVPRSSPPVVGRVAAGQYETARGRRSDHVAFRGERVRVRRRGSRRRTCGPIRAFGFDGLHVGGGLAGEQSEDLARQRCKAEVFKQAQRQAKERLSRLRLERTQLKREISRLQAESRQGSPEQNGAALLDLQNRITRAVERMVELDQRIAAMWKAKT